METVKSTVKLQLKVTAISIKIFYLFSVPLHYSFCWLKLWRGHYIEGSNPGIKYRQAICLRLSITRGRHSVAETESLPEGVYADVDDSLRFCYWLASLALGNGSILHIYTPSSSLGKVVSFSPSSSSRYVICRVTSWRDEWGSTPISSLGSQGLCISVRGLKTNRERRTSDSTSSSTNQARRYVHSGGRNVWYSSPSLKGHTLEGMFL